MATDSAQAVPEEGVIAFGPSLDEAEQILNRALIDFTE
jgi:hypothetical protein